MSEFLREVVGFCHATGAAGVSGENGVPMGGGSLRPPSIRKGFHPRKSQAASSLLPLPEGGAPAEILQDARGTDEAGIRRRGEGVSSAADFF